MSSNSLTKEKATDGDRERVTWNHCPNASASTLGWTIPTRMPTRELAWQLVSRERRVGTSHALLSQSDEPLDGSGKAPISNAVSGPRRSYRFAPYITGGKGLPMRRYPTSSRSFSVSFARQRQGDEGGDVSDAKVLHTAWENDIIWGVETGGKSEIVRGCEVEEEDSVDDAAARERSVPSASASSRCRTASMVAVSMVTIPRVGVERSVPDDGFVVATSLDIDTRSSNSSSDFSTQVAVDDKCCAAASYINFPCVLNKDLEDGSWIAAVGWNSPLEMPKSKLILDENDVSLILTMDDAMLLHGRLVEDGVQTIQESPLPKAVEADPSVIHHSLPAMQLLMTEPELSEAELRQLHRPRSTFKPNERMTFTQPPVVSVEEMAVVAQLKKSSDLNLMTGGKIILVEYTEQNPPMLSNPGMASRILHYWRPPGNGKDTAKAPEMKVGSIITLGPHDKTPFLGDVPPGRVVTSLNSKLYKVPIVQHKPVAPFAPSRASRANGEYELFVLCRSVSKSEKGAAIGESAETTMYIFEIPDLYLAGQIEPQIAVPAPKSKVAQTFVKDYMPLCISRMLKASEDKGLTADAIQRAFPFHPESTVGNVMKKVARLYCARGSELWKRLPVSESFNDEDIIKKLTPESVCVYESMMAAQLRLRDLGISKLLTRERVKTFKGITNAINRLLIRLELRKQLLSVGLVESHSRSSDRIKTALLDCCKTDPVFRELETKIRVARLILDELQTAPWNLTQNYVECHMQGKGLLALGGIGDPTGRGEGFSFVRAPLKNNAHNCKRNGSKRGFSVDDANFDFRKLKSYQLGILLKNLKVPEAEIAVLSRWDRLNLLEEVYASLVPQRESGPLAELARIALKTLAQKRQDYRRRCNRIFKRQLEVLSASTMDFFDGDESEDDSDVLELEDYLPHDTDNNTETAFELLLTRFSMTDIGRVVRSLSTRAEREDFLELKRWVTENREQPDRSNADNRSDVHTDKLRPVIHASGIIEGGSVYTALPVSGGSGSSIAISNDGSSIASAFNIPIEHRSQATSPIGRLKWPASKETPSRAPAHKVLKRTIRRVTEDGTEAVSIEFVVDRKEVVRFLTNKQYQDPFKQVDGHKMLMKRKSEEDKEREQLRKKVKQLDIASQSSNVGKLIREGEVGQGQDGAAQNGRVIRCTRCGQLGHMCTNRSCPVYMADDAKGMTGKGRSGAKNNRKSETNEVQKITFNWAERHEGARQHEAEEKRKRHQQQNTDRPEMH